ncbi:MAG: DUF4397 domain-containing protein [Gammaproteobacteria bacterium]|nr:DUF4397 domain-containing protein [Gammaproteobacteria bacterium]MDH4254776.1 DUF4397 domain-containing protein [Gammaproteobacteria bacterium]MDH5309887.1 DUF4397 domain-containing protein [Gammaproteobacteria bacterium]
MRQTERKAGAGMRGTTIRALVFVVVAIGLVAGCAESSRPVATGKGVIRGMNALIDSPDALFLIEETSLGTVAYKDSTANRSYDDLSYNFNFEIRIAGNASNTRLGTLALDVTKDTEYLFVLTGSVAAPEIVLWQNPAREWAGTETVFELAFGLATQALGDLDVYFAAPGTPPALGSQVGTLGYQQRLDVREFPAGQYELTLTPANDPATVLYRSVNAEYGAAVTNSIVILEGDPSGTAPINARLIPESGGAVELPDALVQPTMRFLHASIATGNVDVARNDDFANLLATNLGFAEVSARAAVPTGVATYDWVPTGNTTPIFSDANRDIAGNSRLLQLLLGEPGNYGVTVLPDIRRGYSTSARIRFNHGSLNVDGPIDVYLAEPGRPLTEVLPQTNFLPFSVSSGYREVQAGDYELTVTRAGNRDTVLAGPEPVALQIGDVVDVVVLDTADPNVSDILVLANTP